MKRILFLNPPVVCVGQAQKGWYSYAHPTSILKLITWHKSQGHEVSFIDCMDYDVKSKEPMEFYKKLPLGVNRLGLFTTAYRLGKSEKWLEEELKKQVVPDEIWVSCHMTFNGELAHETIRIVRRIFPKATIRLGGNYPTLFPEDAARDHGAIVHQGSIPEVNTLFPDYSLFQAPLEHMVFQLDLGCENHCSHCVNSRLQKEIVRFDVDALIRDIREKKEQYNVMDFVNIDPNVACYDFEDFLKACIRERLDVRLYFFGGIQPDKVTAELAYLMKEAGVVGITLPRELETKGNQILQKQYSPVHFYQAIEHFQREGFDLSDFHCSFPVGFRDDSLIDIATVIKEIMEMGAIPEIAPVAYVPSTSAYNRHKDLLAGKNLEELNWALWPALDSQEQIYAHRLLYHIAHGMPVTS